LTCTTAIHNKDIREGEVAMYLRYPTVGKRDRRISFTNPRKEENMDKKKEMVQRGN